MNLTLTVANITPVPKKQRKPLYSLYHLLNHLNLFGRAYLRESLRLATRLNEELARRRD